MGETKITRHRLGDEMQGTSRGQQQDGQTDFESSKGLVMQSAVIEQIRGVGLLKRFHLVGLSKVWPRGKRLS